MENKKSFGFCSVLIFLVLCACRTNPTESVAPQTCPDQKVTSAKVLGHNEISDINELLEIQRHAWLMNSGELVKAIADLNLQPTRPGTQIEKAVFYASLHGTGDLQRAQNLLDQLLKSTDPEAVRYKPMATELTTTYAEMLRLDENIDRLTQQVRDNQKHLDQLAEKLEALKNIERELPARPGATISTDDATTRSFSGDK
jgi:DNA repair ATPase RecN